MRNYLLCNSKKSFIHTQSWPLKIAIRFQQSTRFPNLCACSTMQNNKKKWKYQAVPVSQGKATEPEDDNTKYKHKK